MSNKKQTAVEWLKRDIDYFNSLLKEQGYVEMRISTMAKISQTEHILKYAEKMLEEEKEQAFKFWNGGIECTEEGGKSFEQYYNQTYEK